MKRRLLLLAVFVTVIFLCAAGTAAAEHRITFTNVYDNSGPGDVQTRLENMVNGNPGGVSDLDSGQSSVVVLSVTVKGRTYKSDPVNLSDINELAGTASYNKLFHFSKIPGDLTGAKYNLSVSPSGYTRKPDADGKPQQPVGADPKYYSIDPADGSVVFKLNWKAGSGSGNGKGGKKTYTYWVRLPEDYIGAYHLLNARTHEKEYLVFHTYDICVKYLEDPALCEGYERCFHKDRPCPYWDPLCKHNVKNPDPE